MNTSLTNANCNITNRNEKRASNIHEKSNLYLASGLLSYSIAVVLFSFQSKIIHSTLFKKSSFLLEVLADYLWSAPFAVVTLLILFFISCLYYYAKSKGNHIRYLQLFSHISFMKLLLLSLFFIYTIFPLRWAQRNLTRSP